MSNNQLSPMLACPAPATLQFPLYASPKIDGIRAVIDMAHARSRKMENIPNAFVQSMIGDYALEGFDGELCVGPATAPDLMQKTMSGVMSRDGEPNFTYYVFDLHNMPGAPYHERYDRLLERASSFIHPLVKVLPQILINSQEELDAYEEKCVNEGYEGIMLRRIDGFYKFGRATPKSQLLMKVKRWVDEEMIVTGYVEQMENTNEKVTDKTGHAKRSSAKAGKVPKGRLGTLLGKTVIGGREVEVSNFSDGMRTDLWSIKEKLPGLYCTIKHFNQTGVKDGLRFAQFKSFRDPMDFDL